MMIKMAGLTPHTHLILTVCLLVVPSLGHEEMCVDGGDCGATPKGTRPVCPYPPPNLGEYAVDLTPRHLGDVTPHVGHVRHGGSWSPTRCRARQEVAILVPYRDRLEDLLIFLPNLHGFLHGQLINYTIYLIEQMDRKHFNRGALLNIGFLQTRPSPDCLVLHDVDKFPEDSRNLYMCSDRPVHLISKQRYAHAHYREQPYDDYFGGVTAISAKQFKQINGFSNIFWGWGSEDDDFLSRIKHHGLKPTRVEEELGRFREIWHPFGFVNPKRHEVKNSGPNRFNTDGLNSANYKLRSITKEPLYTHVAVELLNEDPYM